MKIQEFAAEYGSHIANHARFLQASSSPTLRVSVLPRLPDSQRAELQPCAPPPVPCPGSRTPLSVAPGEIQIHCSIAISPRHDGTASSSKAGHGGTSASALS